MNAQAAVQTGGSRYRSQCARAPVHTDHSGGRWSEPVRCLSVPCISAASFRPDKLQSCRISQITASVEAPDSRPERFGGIRAHSGEFHSGLTAAAVLQMLFKVFCNINVVLNLSTDRRVSAHRPRNAIAPRISARK